MALTLCSDYIRQARRILSDEVAEFRYTDVTLLDAIENGLNEMDRLRPDIFLFAPPPTNLQATTSLAIIDRRYRRALLDYIVGFAEMVDDEAASGGRASAFSAAFVSKMMGLSS